MPYPSLHRLEQIQISQIRSVILEKDWSSQNKMFIVYRRDANSNACSKRQKLILKEIYGFKSVQHVSTKMKLSLGKKSRTIDRSPVGIVIKWINDTSWEE